VLDHFQRFAPPLVNPPADAALSTLTGTHQADVDSASAFPAMAEALRAFVARHREAGATWTSWGAWDRKQLDRDGIRHDIVPPIDLPHVNAKRRIGKEVGK
jgi:inhibitor of KinA sporulation pathway (predicted exonuclease)